MNKDKNEVLSGIIAKGKRLGVSSEILGKVSDDSILKSSKDGADFISQFGPYTREYVRQLRGRKANSFRMWSVMALSFMSSYYEKGKE